MTLEIRLLGPPLLISNGCLVRLHSTKVLALLSYLVLEADIPHSRETLAALFWGEKPDELAQHSLRQALYSIHHKLTGLAGSCLQLIENSVKYRPHPDFWVDVHQFQINAESREIDDLQQAVSLYRGVLLEGLALDACPDFEEWLFFRRQALEEQIFDAVKRLTDGLYQRSEYRLAHTFARRLVEMNPLDESAHCYLMRTFAALGDLCGVRQQYKLCVDILAREIGVEPAEETQTTFKQLTVFTPKNRAAS